MSVKYFSDVDVLSDKDFEIFVRDLLIDSGWNSAEITEVGKEYKYGDGGVDIFAYKKGKKYAIEVKKRSAGYTVDTKALNQLVTGAELAKTKNQILVTNSYFTSEVRVRSLKLGVDLIDRDELQNLWIKRNSEIGREIKPRKYQSDIIKDSLELYENGANKMLLEMATGLGKTYTVALLIKSILQSTLRKSRVLFVAHQVEILFQSVTSFKNVFGVGNYTFSACFDGAAPENTDFVFATFDTLHTKLSDLDDLGFDFVIVDEAHHAPAKTYSEVVEHFRPKLLIGLTATPFRADNKSVLDFFGGPNCHVGRYDLAWALKHNKLAFPRYMVFLDDIEQSKLDRLEQGVSTSDIDKSLFLHKKDEEIVSIIERTIIEKEIHQPKGIVFCRNIRHLKHLLAFFPSGSATFVHSKLKDHQRRENLRSFREGDCRFILVCDLFNEGIDIPETNLLVFMRHTGSKTIWLQQLGRGLRKTENKSYVHVLDFVGSIERLMEVRQLSTQVRNMRLDKDNVEASDVKERESIVHDGSIEVHYNDSAAKVLDLLESLSYRLATREVMLDKLRSFYRECGFYPELSKIEDQLSDISADQIATYFDSYFGYLAASLSIKVDVADKIEQLRDIYQEYVSLYGVPPSPRAMTLKVCHGSLPFFTESQVKSFLSDLFGEDKNYKSSGRKELPEIAPYETDAKDEEVPVKAKDEEVPVEADGKKLYLLRKYKGRVGVYKDLDQLTQEEIKEIKREFVALPVFLKELKNARTWKL